MAVADDADDFVDIIQRDEQAFPAQPDENDRARAWAMEKGITDGENPDSPATRQQVWTMLYRMNGGK